MIIHLEKEITGSILDIGGGGEGIIGRLYGQQVIAIDNRRDELEEAPDGFQKLLMDARKLEFDNDTFDAVTFFYSLMFMDTETQKQAIAEANRVLRPGGTLQIWDADILKAHPNPFVVNLDIEIGGTALNTTYGVINDIENQSIHSIATLCRNAGRFSIDAAASADGHFYLKLQKATVTDPNQ